MFLEQNIENFPTSMCNKGHKDIFSVKLEAGM